MTRSTKEQWLQGPGDLKEDEVDDVPAPGMTVRVRALSARYSSEIQGQLKIVNEGREQIAKIDVPKMELLQVVHGCIAPVVTEQEARQIQDRFGSAFKKVIEKIDELSGIDKDAIEATEQRFPSGGPVPAGSALGDGTPVGSAGPDLPVRTGA